MTTDLQPALVDIVLIAESSQFAAASLRRVIEGTYGIRGNQSIPLALHYPPTNWTTPYRALALDTGLAPDIAWGHAVAARFLDPVLGGVAPANAHWQPEPAIWSRDKAP